MYLSFLVIIVLVQFQCNKNECLLQTLFKVSKSYVRVSFKQDSPVSKNVETFKQTFMQSF